MCRRQILSAIRKLHRDGELVSEEVTAQLIGKTTRHLLIPHWEPVSDGRGKYGMPLSHLASPKTIETPRLKYSVWGPILAGGQPDFRAP